MQPILHIKDIYFFKVEGKQKSPREMDRHEITHTGTRKDIKMMFKFTRKSKKKITAVYHLLFKWKRLKV